MPKPIWLTYIKNRYLWASIAFIIWMLFFDSEDLLTQYQLYRQIKQLQKEKAYYVEQIEIIKKERQELLTNEELLEKFAREKYFMKKPTEDIYIIEQPNEGK
jgi:cell division protein DivIC